MMRFEVWEKDSKATEGGFKDTEGGLTSSCEADGEDDHPTEHLVGYATLALEEIVKALPRPPAAGSNNKQDDRTTQQSFELPVELARPSPRASDPPPVLCLHLEYACRSIFRPEYATSGGPPNEGVQDGVREGVQEGYQEGGQEGAKEGSKEGRGGGEKKGRVSEGIIVDGIPKGSDVMRRVVEVVKEEVERAGRAWGGGADGAKGREKCPQVNTMKQKIYK
jgi:hypothetical protein